jgi:hypothetical protein
VTILLISISTVHGIMDGEGVQNTDACEFEDFDIYRLFSLKVAPDYK